MNVYKERTANYPRNNSDVFFDVANKKEFSGILDKNLRFIEEIQLKDINAWKNFVLQFKTNSDDTDAGWRGEFWGKMMRGACFVYSYSKDQGLYDILKDTVGDIMSAQDDLGRISTYSVENEFDGWDMWARKYILLGMQYFLEICKEPDLAQKIINSMCLQADYIISKIGNADGQKPITKATRHWRGLNSCSILEPMVRLYSLTNEQKYLDFAEYIVLLGGTDVENIFELAYKNELRPYQYPVTKAYEMTSCFMGLLEYYRINKNERHKTALINFANCILEDEFTVIGSCGCTHELFDHSAVRQANTTNGDIAQETCVTVTLMQFFYQLSLLTGDPKYMDAFEISLYNAYLGAINTDGAIGEGAKQRYPDLADIPLAFDSYSPLTAGTRGNGIGGLRRMENGFHYGCCACIGSAGIGLAMKSAVLTTQKGIAINLFEKGSVAASLPNGKEINLNIDTDYPKSEKVRITVNICEGDPFEILIRNPYWSENTKILLNGQIIETTKGYISVNREWNNGDKIEITFDMRTKAIYPKPYGSQVLMNKVVWGANYMVPTFDKEDPIAKNHIALMRGPLMLAQDNRLGYSVDTPVSVKVENGFVSIEGDDKASPYECIFNAKIPTKNGKSFTVTDYASAGKSYNNDSKMAVWMLTE